MPIVNRISALLFFLLSFSVSGVAQSNCLSQKQFQFFLGNAPADNAFEVIGTSDSCSIVAGVALTNTQPIVGATIIKLKQNGNIAWAYQWKSSQGEYAIFYRVIEDSDKNLTAFGFVRNGFDANTLVVKLNPSGSVLWQKEIQISGAGQQWGLMLAETPDKNYLLTINHNNQNSTQVQAQVVKLSGADGTLIWERLYRFNNSMEPRSIIIDGTSAVIAGVVTGPNQSANDGVVMKINHSNGSIVWQKYIDCENKMNRLLDIKKVGNEYWLVMQNGIGNTDNGVLPALLKMNQNGDITNALQFSFLGKNADNYPGRWLSICKNGDFVQGYMENKSGSQRTVMARHKSDGSVIWSKEYFPVVNGYLNRIAEDAEGNILLTGKGSMPSNPTTGMFLIKADANGNIPFQTGNCEPQNQTVEVRSQSFQTYTANIQSSNPSNAVVVNSSLEVVHYTPNILLACATTNCNVLSISGPSGVCFPDTVAKFVATKTAGCTIPVKWQFDSSLLSVFQQSGDTIWLQKRVANVVKTGIKATLESCTSISDSVDVYIQSSPTPELIQTRDTAICAPSLLIQVPAGLLNYTWSNGQTGESITITQSGTYWVQAQSFCNALITDTITIQLNEAGKLSLGNDSSVCLLTPFQLQPPIASNISSLKWNTGEIGTAIQINTAGKYWISATDLCNNILSDTIEITAVDLAADLNLGPDQLYCAPSDAPKQLQIQAKYQTYLWNTGATTSVITATSPGTYWLQTTDYCGVTNTDTLLIVRQAAALTGFGKDSVVCGNFSFPISGPNGMQHYLWNNGSTTAQINVTQGGKYWLTITDFCNQSATDSFSIEQNDLASAFSLGPDISRCEFKPVSLAAPSGNYRYSWNTGASTNTYTANQPGVFAVTITDQCNNAFTDSIELLMLPMPSVTLGSDTSICSLEPYLLQAGNFNNYRWNNGSTSSSISITQSGRYWVQVSNTFGCTNSDSIYIRYTNADLRALEVPNAFTPNGDGLNDCFGISKWGDIPVLRFDIYNRWGSKVFSGKSTKDCWNGKINGMVQANSSFAYIIVAESACGIIERKGLVTTIQ